MSNLFDSPTYTEPPPLRGTVEEYESALKAWHDQGGDGTHFTFSAKETEDRQMPLPPQRPHIVDWIVSTGQSRPDSLANTGDRSGSDPRTEDGMEFRAPAVVKYTHPLNPFATRSFSGPRPRQESIGTVESSRGASQLPDISLDESKQSIVHVFFQLEERDVRSHLKRSRRQEINAFYKIFKEEKTRIEREDARSLRRLHETEKHEESDRLHVESDEVDLRIRLREKMEQSERIAQLEAEVRQARFTDFVSALSASEVAYRRSLQGDETHVRNTILTTFQETYPPPEPESDSSATAEEVVEEREEYDDTVPQPSPPAAWETLKELREESADPSYITRWMENVPGTGGPASQEQMKVLREIYSSLIQRLRQRRTNYNLNGWRVSAEGDPLHFRGLRDPSSPRRTILGKCHADMEEFTKHVLTPRSQLPTEASPQQGSIQVPRFERIIRREDEEEVQNILRNIERVKRTSWRRHTHSVRDRPLFPQDAGCEIYRREPGPNMGVKDDAYEMDNQQRHKEALERLGHDPNRYKDMYARYIERQAEEDKLEREEQERRERALLAQRHSSRTSSARALQGRGPDKL